MLYLSTILHIALAINDQCHYHKTLFRILNEVNLIISSILLTVRKSDVGYCKNYYLKLSKESQTFENFTNSSKGFQINVFNLVVASELPHILKTFSCP